MNFSEAEAFLCNEKAQNIKPGTGRVTELLERLGFPGRSIPLIHVVGTNGKGSTVTMLSSCLAASGVKTGSFLSPRLYGPSDYFRINGESPDPEAFVRAVERVSLAASHMADYPTEFELSTVTALCLFEETDCRVMVLEAGMGGKMDATNLPYSSLLTVVTHIALDHTGYLGSTAEEILKEKLGIVKPFETVIMAENSSELRLVAESGAKNTGYEVIFTDPLRDTGLFEQDLRLSGSYQRKNLRTVLTALSYLSELYPISEEHIRIGLRRAELPFRFMLLRENPDIIFDGGHNPDCIRVLTEALRERNENRRYVLVTGVMRDKAYAEMYRLLEPFAESFVTLTAPNSRALTAEELGMSLASFGKPVFRAPSIAESAEFALKQWENGANILCAGSLYFMPELYEEIRKRLESLRP